MFIPSVRGNKWGEWGRMTAGEWRLEAGGTYLAGDEVLADGQCHLNSVGFVRDGDGVEFKPVSAVHHAGLVHRILKHLLVALLA